VGYPVNRLVVALVASAFVALFEFIGGYLAHSLALTTDAVHVCTDVFAFAVAVAAAAGMRRPADAQRTFGYGRLEVLGALASGTLLLGATLVIVYEAAQRFGAPIAPRGELMTAFAAAGLVVNGAIGLSLRVQSREDLNVRAALYHVAGDALGAFAVIVGGIVIARTGAAWLDPALSLLVAGIIVVGVVRVLADTTGVLLEAVPSGLDVAAVRRSLQQLHGVAEVHDLHVWTIGGGSRALSAHVLIADRQVSEATAILKAIDAEMRSRYAITHVTVQFECESCEPDERVVCTQRATHVSGPRRPVKATRNSDAL